MNHGGIFDPGNFCFFSFRVLFQSAPSLKVSLTEIVWSNYRAFYSVPKSIFCADHFSFISTYNRYFLDASIFYYFTCKDAIIIVWEFLGIELDLFDPAFGTKIQIP